MGGRAYKESAGPSDRVPCTATGNPRAISHGRHVAAAPRTRRKPAAGTVDNDPGARLITRLDARKSGASVEAPLCMWLGLDRGQVPVAQLVVHGPEDLRAGVEVDTLGPQFGVHH